MYQRYSGSIALDYVAKNSKHIGWLTVILLSEVNTDNPCSPLLCCPGSEKQTGLSAQQPLEDSITALGAFFVAIDICSNDIKMFSNFFFTQCCLVKTYACIIIYKQDYSTTTMTIHSTTSKRKKKNHSYQRKGQLTVD